MSQDTSFPTRPFQQRIMRPMIPIIAIAFLVLALVIIAAVLVDARNRLTSTHLLAMNTLSREVTSDLARTIDEIIDVAISVPLRQFAVENTEPTLTSGDDISDIPGLQAITQLVDRRSDTYLSARYITRFGLPLVEFSNNEGLIQHTINTDENASDWIFDPGFQIALGSTPGRVIMGDFSLQTDSNGLPYSPSVPVINLLTPVVNPADTSETMGVLHVELLANSLLDVVNLASAR